MKGQESVWRGVSIFALMVVVGIMGAGQAQAHGGRYDHDWPHGWGHYKRHHHRHHDHYETIFTLPGKFLTITIGGEQYYHCKGRYYRRHRHGDFIEVSNPYRVVITRIPRGCRKVNIGGRDYYTDNKSYYEEVDGGYRQVDRPQSSRNNDRGDDESYGADGPLTVNIPNRHGGYTTVNLIRSGSGYTGPQGEYYPEFPKVEQLRAMYGK